VTDETINIENLRKMYGIRSPELSRNLGTIGEGNGNGVNSFVGIEDHTRP